QSLKVPPPAPGTARSSPGRIVLLPFADYSQGDVLGPAFRRDVAIMEAFTDALVARGFRMPVQEDVFQYLVDQKIIQLVAYDRKQSGASTRSLEEELAGDWSEAMKAEISGLIAQERQRTQAGSDPAGNPLAQPGTHGLHAKELARLGQAFNARYVLRGRIIQYDRGTEPTWDPFKRGFLPVFFGATNRLMYGIARSDSYDTIGQTATGAILGGVLGHEATTPFSPPDLITTTTTSGPPLAPVTTTSTSEVGGFSDYDSLNTLAWGAVGAGAAYLASKGGVAPQAVVELRVWVQDSTTGDVLWTNRAEVKVAPETMFAASDDQTLFGTALRESVASLVHDFATRVDL
ncbi:MAG: hypothetical protein AB1634_10290, partial [Thermodesulfobacteriota bacterium]